MGRPFIERAQIQDVGCVKDVDLHLTRLHALIGPNDSGKSTILGALHSGAARVSIRGVGGWKPADPEEWKWEGTPDQWGPRALDASDQLVLRRAFELRSLLRLRPDSIRRESQLIPQNQPLWFGDESGLGTAALYDALLTRDIDAYQRLSARFRELFPNVKAIRLVNKTASTKSLGIVLHDGTEVRSDRMSEGMLYWLAFAVIEYLEPRGMLLVEEPETGLHPARIREVLTVLRDASSRTQIVLATHSPLVVNEMNPDEVTVVTRRGDTGTRCTPIRETRHFDKRSQVYALGELWVSYADGDVETDLVSDPAPREQAG